MPDDNQKRDPRVPKLIPTSDLDRWGHEVGGLPADVQLRGQLMWLRASGQPHPEPTKLGRRLYWPEDELFAYLRGAYAKEVA